MKNRTSPPWSTKELDAAIDPLREAIIAACKKHGLHRPAATAALAVILGLEAQSDGCDLDKFMVSMRALVGAGMELAKLSQSPMGPKSHLRRIK